VDPEGGGVVVELVDGDEAGGGALDGRRDGVDDDAAEGQTGPLVRSGERLGRTPEGARPSAGIPAGPSVHVVVIIVSALLPGSA
jgi:hypothetical protein